MHRFRMDEKALSGPVDVSENAQEEPGLLEALADQWPSMLGMAGMFVVTIVLGLIMQPFYESNNLQAFGSDGAEQARYIGLELLFLFLFTGLILLLARYKLDWVIKYGLMFVLWLALTYTTVPYMHLLTVDAPDPFTTEDTEIIEPVMLGAEPHGPDRIASWSDGLELHHEVTDPGINSIHHVTMMNATDVVWNVSFNRGNRSIVESGELAVATTLEALTLADGHMMWHFDRATGTPIGDPLDCTMQGLDEGCHLGFLFDGRTYGVDPMNRLVRLHPNPSLGVVDGRWYLPTMVSGDADLIHAEQIGPDSMIMVDSEGASWFQIPTRTEGLGDRDGVSGPVSEHWNLSAENHSLSSFALGAPPGEADDGNERMLLLGFQNGTIHDVTLDGRNSTITSEGRFRIEMDSAVRGIGLLDWDESGRSDLVLVDTNSVNVVAFLHEVTTMQAAFGWTNVFTAEWVESPEAPAHPSRCVPYRSSEAPVTCPVHLTMVEGEIHIEDEQRSLAVQAPLTTAHLESWDATATTIGLVISILLMLLLYLHSEWYVVNTVGVLVGAGVVTMLGVSFVPWLIILFMVLAAIYDAWAVYRSKHMLTLADTMIGLNLPILLVAPQEKGYSMKNERGDRMRRAEDAPAPVETTPSSDSPKVAQRRPKRDAMFMGLGDVIFPGMLVISAYQYAPGSSLENLALAIATIVGGLAGYLVLMTYVARGRPQAGLPLLNSGAILGYLIAALLFIGPEALAVNVRF